MEPNIMELGAGGWDRTREMHKVYDRRPIMNLGHVERKNHRQHAHGEEPRRDWL